MNYLLFLFWIFFLILFHYLIKNDFSFIQKYLNKLFKYSPLFKEYLKKYLKTILYTFFTFIVGKHIRKEKKSIVWILITLFVLIGVIFGCFHFKSDDQENLSQYKTIVGTIKNVGDETLLIETNDHQKYLISIAGAIDSNKGLIKGNRIYIYYEGTLDIKNKDIQSIKVKSYKY